MTTVAEKRGLRWNASLHRYVPMEGQITRRQAMAMPALVAMPLMDVAKRPVDPIAWDPDAHRYTDITNAVSQVVFPEAFGAKGDGVSNDTAAFAGALASLDPSKGGIIQLTAAQYAANIGPINQNNVTIRGWSLFAGDTCTCRIVPWDITKPVIQVANDTQTVHHFQLDAVGLYATGPNGTGQIGLDIQGGAYECFYDRHSIIGFSQYQVRVQCGTNPVSLQWFSRFKYDAEEAACNACVRVAQPNGAASYTSAVYFGDGHINSPATNYDTGTASGGSTGTLVDSSKAWTANAYAGATVKITAGTGSGQYGYVTSNTATTLTLQGTWTLAPDATSTYEIMQGYTLDLDGVNMTFHNVYCDITDGHGVRFQRTNAGAPYPTLECSGSVNFDSGSGKVIAAYGSGMNTPNWYPSMFGEGTFFNGSFLAEQGALVALPSSAAFLGYGPVLGNPTALGSMQFQDSGSGNVFTDTNISVTGSGTLQLLAHAGITLLAKSGIVSIEPAAGNETIELDLYSNSIINKIKANNGLLSITPATALALGSGAPPTTATTGFPYMPAVAGAPTGIPTAEAGYVPFQYDTTNHKLWIYDGGWKGVVLA